MVSVCNIIINREHTSQLSTGKVKKFQGWLQDNSSTTARKSLTLSKHPFSLKSFVSGPRHVKRSWLVMSGLCGRRSTTSHINSSKKTFYTEDTWRPALSYILIATLDAMARRLFLIIHLSFCKEFQMALRKFRSFHDRNRFSEQLFI